MTPLDKLLGTKMTERPYGSLRARVRALPGHTVEHVPTHCTSICCSRLSESSGAVFRPAPRRLGIEPPKARSSETIGAIVTALAKAQAELSNPGKRSPAPLLPKPANEPSGTHHSPAGSTSCGSVLAGTRSHSLQTTAVDHGQITPTNLLVHDSGNGSPRCARSESPALLPFSHSRTGSIRPKL